MTPEHIRQQHYRARRTEKIERMAASLEAIIVSVGDKTGPVASEVRALALKGLGR